MKIENSKNLGNIASGKKYEIVFFHETPHNIKDVIISSSCSCSKVRWNGINGICIVYNPTAVPYHLLKQGINNYKISKQVTVDFRFTTGEQQRSILTFNAVVFDKLPKS